MDNFFMIYVEGKNMPYKRFETLEEAKQRILDSNYMTKNDADIFEMGVKWQEQRMYSEEDLEKSFEAGRSYEEIIQGQKAILDWEGKIDYKPKSFIEWLEQNKKK